MILTVEQADLDRAVEHLVLTPDQWRARHRKVAA